MKKIEGSIQNILLLCNKAQKLNLASFNIDCNDVLNPLEILINSNELKYQSMSHLIFDKRTKRALEFGGEILKFFFGTLDADDARKYDEAISACQQNENEIYSLMKDNVHIVQSTISNFNISIEKLNNNEIRLNNQLEKLNYIFLSNSKTNVELMNLGKFNSIFNIIEGSLLSISNILDTILNSILFAKANILHPYVITPTKLYKLLSSDIKIKRTTEFPISLSLQNIHTIIDLAKLTSYYYNEKIVFIIQIPLINPIKFSLYKNLALPTPNEINNYKTYVLIHPSKLYLAVTDDRLNYAVLDSISDCKRVNKEYMVCPMAPILSTINNPICETKLLTEVTLALPEICDSKIIYGNINVWQKLNDGRYIFVQSKPNKLTLKCDDNINDYILQGTGILSLEKNCIAYFQTLQFVPFTNYKTILPAQILLNYNIVEDDCCKYNLVNETYQSLSPITLSNIDLESLKFASHKLDHLEDQINQASSQSHIIKYGHYYSGMTYFILTLTIPYVLYKIYKKCFCKNTNTSCCIQIYNQCHNSRRTINDRTMNTSIELSDISNESECDRRSVKSLPAEIEFNKKSNKVVYRNFDKSHRNLNNF